jgi:hypothetical protein
MVWWLWLLIGFVAGFIFTASVAGGVCLYGWRNKDKMARAMLHHMMSKSHANS